MQIDATEYNIWYGGPYSYEHLLQGTSILISKIKGVKQYHNDWSKDMVLKGGICAYNSNVESIKNYTTMDSVTTNSDFSNDVTARSQFFYDEGF